jgi:hypothetical protein
MQSRGRLPTTAAILACLAVSCGLPCAIGACGGDAGGAEQEAEGGATAPSREPDSDAGDAAIEPRVDAQADSARPANPIVGENELPGSADWALVSPATQREIEGYPSSPSVAAGEAIRIFASTASARYTVGVYRLGWYQGTGARLVAPAVERDGHVQVVPSPDADGLVECDWIDPYVLTIPASWVSGLYVAKLTTKDTGMQSYVPFVVRDDVRVATYLVQSSVTTFQAYNNWGGRSLYDFNSAGGVRASRVSLLRPYALGLNPQSAAGVGAGELITNLQGAAQTGPMGWEYPTARFLEREGYDVSYVTNVDVHRDASLVAKHPVFVSVGHDEYWSQAMRDHVEDARDHGATSLALLSGNVSYWQVRLVPAKSGAPDATITCHKDAASDPLSATADVHRTTVRFGDPLLARGEEGLGGLAFQDYGINADLVVDDAKSWVFGATGLALGAHVPGLLGYEVEGSPEPPLAGVRRVTRSPWTTPQPTSGSSDAAVRALPSGAETFAAGTIQLGWGLDDYRPKGVTQPVVTSAAAQQMVRNVLDRFAAPRAARVRTPRLLDETFSGALDPERWSLRTVNEGYAALDPAVGVAVAGGRLTITPRTGVVGLHHGALTSARTFPMACAAARVELVQAASALSGADTTFAVVASPARFYRMTVEAGALALGIMDDGAASSTSLAYDPVQHRHLRIRHDCVSDQVVFETSPDGAAWTARRTATASVDLRAAYVELDAGTYQAEAAPGQAIFDDVRVEHTGVRERFSAQRDPETFTPDSLHEGGFDPSVEVFTGGGRLHLRPRAGVAGQHHKGFATTREIDWRGGSASVAVVQSLNPATEASLSLAVVSQAPGWARVTVSAGNIYFQSERMGVTTSTLASFDPVAHHELRIRHDAAGDELVWETSPDGVAWTEQRRVARPFPLTAMRAEIGAGSYRAETDPGEAIVDDFVFAR